METEIQNLMENSLGYKRGESINLIYDNNYQTIGDLIIKYCKERNIPITKIFKEYSPSEILPGDIKSSFLDDKPEIVILGLSNNIWHTPERKSAKYEKKKRLVNLLHPNSPCVSYLANIQTMNKIGKQLSKILEESNRIHIFSNNGTEIEAQIGRCFCETGDYREYSSGGDFPSGEVGFGPVEGTINGRIVYDLKVQHVGFVRDYPHIVEVKNDEVTIVRASDRFRLLMNKDAILRYLSEISIGINPIWAEVQNIDSIVEEKNLGTVHFGQGGNLSYGNRKGQHFDSVIQKPTIYLDNCLIMREGLFNESYINLKI